MKKKVWMVVLLTVSLVLMMAVAGLAAKEKVKVLKISHLNAQKPFEVATAAMAQVFQSMVESGTNGRIKVEIYPNGTLGNERESMEQVEAGIIQSYIASGGGMATFYPLFSVVNIPFSITDYSVAYKVYDGPFGQELSKNIENKTNFAVLGYGESGGFFQLTNNVRPVRTPADMKGIKFRTMSIPIHMEFMRSLGAAPTTIAWAEVYTSLQTGVVDGQHNPVPIIQMAKFEEVQKYMTVTNHMYTPYVWVINKEWLHGLTAEEQAVIVEAAKVAVVASRGINRIFEATENGLPYLSSKMQVYTPTQAELQAFKDITIPASMTFIEKEYGKEGKELAQKYLQAIEDAKKN